MEESSRNITESSTTSTLMYKKKKKILLVILILVIVAIIFGSYWIIYGRTIEETDNAYVNSSQNIITAQISGTIKQLTIDNTQYIKKGELIAVIDDIDYKIELEKSVASLSKAVRFYSNLSSQVAQLKENVIEKENQMKKSETDFIMDKASYSAGLISKHQYLVSKNNLNIAIAALEQSRKALKNAEIQADSNSIMLHPEIQQAIAVYKKAYVNLMRTKIYAPISGIVAKKSVFIGQEISPSQDLLTLIDLENIWVDANLKETQMKNIKLGNRVVLTSDINSKKYTGYIQGISAGTGSALSLLPAQNATGNWIKIVQRVPVRIHIDSKSIEENGTIPIGSSMKAIIYLEKIDENILPYKEKTSSLYIMDEVLINQEIEKIIQINLGKE